MILVLVCLSAINLIKYDKLVVAVITTLCLSLVVFFFLLFLSCPFFLSVPASLSDQLGQVRSLGGSGGGGGGLSLLLYLFVCLPVVQRMYLFTCLFILIALFVRSLINLDK